MWIERRKKSSREQDDLIRLALLFRILPSEIDERMTGREAADILEYLSRYPATEDLIDTQVARVIQLFCSMGGNQVDLNEIRMRGTRKDEIEIAQEWIQWIDERKNRTCNQL